MADILVKPGDLEKAVEKALESLDADSYARIAGEILGGKCFFKDSEKIYLFVPDENYSGAFGE